MPPPLRLPKTGNSFIDADHVALARLIRDATLQARNAQSDAAFVASVADFRAALARHFELEGVLVGGAGFAATAEHLRRHQEILAELDEVLQAPADTPAARFGLVERMEHILHEHEIVEDSRYWTAVRAGAGEGGPPVRWSDDLAIGIDWVDAQHRDMVTLLAELWQAARDPARQSELAGLLARFQQHARDHFAEEESRLEARGLAVSDHRRGHLALLDELDRFAETWRARPEALTSEYLGFWLLDHIRGSDRRDFAGWAEGA